jgi:hypothetical protein
MVSQRLQLPRNFDITLVFTLTSGQLRPSFRARKSDWLHICLFLCLLLNFFDEMFYALLISSYLFMYFCLSLTFISTFLFTHALFIYFFYLFISEFIYINNVCDYLLFLKYFCIYLCLFKFSSAILAQTVLKFWISFMLVAKVLQVCQPSTKNNRKAPNTYTHERQHKIT